MATATGGKEKAWRSATQIEKAGDRLFAALKIGDAPGVRQALADGASACAKKNAWRPLLWALTYGFDDSAENGEAALRELLGAASLEELDPERSALRPAARWAGARGVEALAAAGADVNAGAGEETALHVAARTGGLKAAQALLRAGASPLALNSDGLTAEALARSSGASEELIQALQMARLELQAQGEARALDGEIEKARAQSGAKAARGAALRAGGRL